MLVRRHNDVIMGNMEGLVTLVFFKIESKSSVSWGILLQILKKLYTSKFKPSMTSVRRQYDVIIGIFQGPVTLPFLKVKAQNLVG